MHTVTLVNNPVMVLRNMPPMISEKVMADVVKSFQCRQHV
jgi:hypothetical protein